MIIVCPECSTKFKLGIERIPEKGAKVRCARCKHIFRVERPTMEEPQEETVIDTQVTSHEFEATSEPQPEEPAETPAAEVDESKDSEFSYEQFQRLDSGEDIEESSFTFDAQADDSADEQDFSFSEERRETETPIEKIISSKDEMADDSILSQQFSEPDAIEDDPVPQAAEKKGGALSSLIRILLILILGILVVAGVLIYMNGTDQVSQTIQQLLGNQTERPAQTGRISLANLEGQFVHNEQAGELFLISGEAINDFPDPRAGIQVKGVIFDQNGKPLLQKTVFCGNPISKEQLGTLSFPELEKIMGNQFGEELQNMKVSKGQSIPFDIVFKDLPQNLSEFSVKVTASKPASK